MGWNIIYVKCFMSSKGPLTCLQRICSYRVCGFCYHAEED